MGIGVRVQEALIYVSNRLNEQLRLRDFDVNRVRGGWAQRVFGITGYPAYTILLFFPILAFLYYGPAWDRWRGIELFVALLATVAVSWFLAHFLSEHRRWLQQGQTILVLCVALALSLWNYSRPTPATEADPAPYQHIMLLVLPALLTFATLVPPRIADFLVAGFKRRHAGFGRRFALALRRAELLTVHQDIRFSLAAVGHSILVFPFRRPTHALLFPAIAVLLVPYHFQEYAAVTVLLLNSLLFGLGGVHPRLHAMLTLIDRVFFFGGQWCLSLLVIALAFCRIFDYSYVSIVLNSIHNNALLFFLFCAYCTLWLYETWLHFVLCERLLPLLNGGLNRTASWIDYSIDPAASLPNINPDSRTIQILGARFVAVGVTKEPTPGLPSFEMYEKIDLLQALTTRAYPKVKPNVLERVFGLSELNGLVQSYFAILNTCILCLLALSWYVARPDTIPVRLLSLFHVAHTDNTVPELIITGPTSVAKRVGQSDSKVAQMGYQGLREDLFSSDAKRQVVLVAASGGGTRAALYSASLFRGLANLRALEQTRLASGVSGGSAAIAYLAIHHNELVKDNSPKAWETYFDVMAHPYIDDVIHGSAELRLLHGTRTGTLLAESFARNMVGHTQDLPTLLGEADFGVLFNCTIGGQAGWSDGKWELPLKTPAGDKLVITNAVPREAFPLVGYSGPAGSMKDQFLHFEYLDNPNIHLTDAAALSANFPPVFPDALIRVEGEKESWVTDGGASENRGLVGLLYALEYALKNPPPGTTRNLPRIHIIIAEASAVSKEYVLDRGVGAAIASSGKGAAQVAADHLDTIAKLYAGLGGNSEDFNVWYLPMPEVFVEGGIATHWMMPSFVQLRNLDAHGQGQTILLTGRVAKLLVADLHRLPTEPWSLHPNPLRVEDVKTVEGWLDADPHRREWNRFVEAWQHFP